MPLFPPVYISDTGSPFHALPQHCCQDDTHRVYQHSLACKRCQHISRSDFHFGPNRPLDTDVWHLRYLVGFSEEKGRCLLHLCLPGTGTDKYRVKFTAGGSQHNPVQREWAPRPQSQALPHSFQPVKSKAPNTQCLQSD